MEFRIWSFNELRITFVDRLLEDIQDAKLQLMNEIDAIDFWKQMRIAYAGRLFEDIQDAKLQYTVSIYFCTGMVEGLLQINVAHGGQFFLCSDTRRISRNIPLPTNFTLLWVLAGHPFL